MNQISEQELRDAVIATKKDAKLVAAAKNDRTNAPESLYKEFSKLTVDRQREIIISICNDFFVAAQWKIAFPLNNAPLAQMADVVSLAGKTLFFTREADSVRESIYAAKIYRDSSFFKQIVTSLSEAAESVGIHLASIAAIISSPDVYGMIRELDPTSANSEKIVRMLCKTGEYTRDLKTTLDVGSFLYSRRFNSNLDELIFVLENSIFMRRDTRSVREILSGLGAGSIDVVLQKKTGDKQVLSMIRDVAWKTGDAKSIRNYLQQYL